MELQFFNTPKKSLCFASTGEPSMLAWHRVKAMQAPWLVVLGADGKPTGVMPMESMRDAMRAFGTGLVGSLPFRGVAVLPHDSKLSQVLAALASPEIEAVLIADGREVKTVVMRQPTPARPR